MIYWSLKETFKVMTCSFWSTVLHCGAQLPIQTVNYWTVYSVVPVFLTGGVLECDGTHRRRRSVVVLCMLYKQVEFDAVSIRYATSAVYAFNCYTRCFVHTLTPCIAPQSVLE